MPAHPHPVPESQLGDLLGQHVTLLAVADDVEADVQLRVGPADGLDEDIDVLLHGQAPHEQHGGTFGRGQDLSGRTL